MRRNSLRRGIRPRHRTFGPALVGSGPDRRRRGSRRPAVILESSVRVLSGYRPSTVRVLSGYCPGTVRVPSGRSCESPDGRCIRAQDTRRAERLVTASRRAQPGPSPNAEMSGPGLGPCRETPPSSRAARRLRSAVPRNASDQPFRETPPISRTARRLRSAVPRDASDQPYRRASHPHSSTWPSTRSRIVASPTGLRSWSTTTAREMPKRTSNRTA